MHQYLPGWRLVYTAKVWDTKIQPSYVVSLTDSKFLQCFWGLLGLCVLSRFVYRPGQYFTLHSSVLRLATFTISIPLKWGLLRTCLAVPFGSSLTPPQAGAVAASEELELEVSPHSPLYFQSTYMTLCHKAGSEHKVSGCSGGWPLQ